MALVVLVAVNATVLATSAVPVKLPVTLPVTLPTTLPVSVPYRLVKCPSAHFTALDPMSLVLLVSAITSD